MYLQSRSGQVWSAWSRFPKVYSVTKKFQGLSRKPFWSMAYYIPNLQNPEPRTQNQEPRTKKCLSPVVSAYREQQEIDTLITP